MSDSHLSTLRCLTPVALWSRLWGGAGAIEDGRGVFYRLMKWS